MPLIFQVVQPLAPLCFYGHKQKQWEQRPLLGPGSLDSLDLSWQPLEAAPGVSGVWVSTDWLTIQKSIIAELFKREKPDCSADDRNSILELELIKESYHMMEKSPYRVPLWG